MKAVLKFLIIEGAISVCIKTLKDVNDPPKISGKTFLNTSEYGSNLR